MVDRVIQNIYKAIIADDKNKMIIVFKKRIAALALKSSTSNIPTIMSYDPVSESSNKW